MKYIQQIAGRSGIYIISNTIDSRIYIGSATSFRHRCAVHKRTIKEGKHGNPKLMAFANKYGIDKLIFTATFACPIEDLLKYEQEFLDKYQPFEENGFNILKTAGSPIGYKHTEEAKQKMKGRKGPHITIEGRKRISESKKGISRSDSTKKKLSEYYNNIKKPIVCYNAQGFVAEYDCVGDAAKSLNIDKGNIKGVIAGRQKVVKGYVFFYKSILNTIDIDSEIKNRYTNKRFRKLIVLDLLENITSEYISVSECARTIISNPASIVTAIDRESPLYGRYVIKYK